MGRNKILTFELAKEIVQQLADDTRVKDLAIKAGISEKAMDSRIVKIRATYGLKSISGLCVYFLRQKWIK